MFSLLKSPVRGMILDLGEVKNDLETVFPTSTVSMNAYLLSQRDVADIKLVRMYHALRTVPGTLYVPCTCL